MDENNEEMPITYYTVDALQDREAGAMYNVLVPNSDGSGMTSAILTFQDDGKYTIVNPSTNESIPVSTSEGIRVVDVDAYRTKVDNYQSLSGTGAATTTTTTNNEPAIKVPDFEHTTPSLTESKYVRHDINSDVFIARTKQDYIDYVVSSSRGNISREQATQMAEGRLKNGTLFVAEGEGANINNGTASTTTTTTEPTASNQTARLNGIGSTDMPDMHDDKMHHTHVTQKVGSGEYIGGKDDYTNSAENYRQLQTDESGNVLVDENGYAKKNLSYKPGETRTLADNPYLASISQKNILGNTDHKSFSKLDYICAYAATGQWSAKDLKVTVDYLASECDVKFAAHPQHYFKGTIFETIYNKVQDTDYKAKEEAIRSLVEELETKFKAKHDEMIGWCGSAYDSSTSAVQCILGKFEVTMGNILQALEPSCSAMSKFKEDLKALKEKEENELEPKKLEVKNAENEKNNAQSTYDGIHVPRRKYDDGKCTNESEVRDAERRKSSAWDDFKAKEGTYNTLNAELEELMNVMDEMLLNVVMEYFQIKNFDSSVQTFASFFGLGSGPDRSGMIASKAALLQNHDAILTEFEDYSKMPVITNLSDYKVGDVIIFDDAHGYVYAVTGPFDPLTGTITIGCFDRNGNKIGDDIVIWDQREIVPIKYVREYDPEIYEGYPDTFLTTAPEAPIVPPVDDKPPVVKPPVGSTPPTNPTTPPTNPSTNPTTPPTNPTTPPTNPTTPPTNPTTPPTSPTTPPTSPTTPPTYITSPPTTWPTSPQNPYGPHTGLDAIYSSGDTTQSSSGLGALAGLAVGAAGLGLTGLMDKDKDEEKDKEKEKDNEAEKENKEEEKKDEVKEETKEEQQEQTTEATTSVDIHE